MYFLYQVREGKCPVVPQICRSGEKIENICQSNDMKCKDGEKCCLVETGGLCVRMCVKAEEGNWLHAFLYDLITKCCTCNTTSGITFELIWFQENVKITISIFNEDLFSRMYTLTRLALPLQVLVLKGTRGSY